MCNLREWYLASCVSLTGPPRIATLVRAPAVGGTESSSYVTHPRDMVSSADAHLAGRLRLALAIGREQRAAALAAPERARTVESCAGIAPLLSVGVITAPLNVWRRRRIRWARDVVMARADRCAVVLTFILGHPSMLSPAERRVVTSEQRVHKDLVLLDAHDGIGGAVGLHAKS